MAATSQLSADTPIFKLTVGEFIELLSQHTPSTGSPATTIQSQKADYAPSDRQYVYGIGGLARLLDVSHPTAYKLKASGKIPFAQFGRKLIFDEQAVMAALGKSPSK